jgi:hypothetical protein
MRKGCARGLYGTVHVAEEGDGRDAYRGGRAGAAAVLLAASSLYLSALRDSHRYRRSSQREHRVD